MPAQPNSLERLAELENQARCCSAAFAWAEGNTAQALAFLGGELWRGRFWRALGDIKTDETEVIAVDSGASFCLNNGLHPDLLIGDMDSISPDMLEKLQQPPAVEMRRYPERKDETDGELLIRELARYSYERILLFAGLSASRPDHVLMNYEILFNPVFKGRQIRLTDGERLAIPIHGGDCLEFQLPTPQFGRMIVSMIAYSESVLDINYEGLSYPLHHATLYRGSSLALSNYPAAYDLGGGDVRFRMAIGDGRALVLISPDDQLL